MTRINARIPPSELCDVHLQTEHREIKRIPNTISKGRYNMDGIPDSFCLGPGHVKFFYNKMLFLRDRYLSLREECLRRGLKAEDYSAAWDGVPESLMQDWSCSEWEEALANGIVRKRLKEKLMGMKIHNFTQVTGRPKMEIL